MQQVTGTVNGLLMLFLFVAGSGLIFMVYAKLWMAPIIIETILSLNPYFASGFIWIKYVFTYYYWRIESDFKLGNSIEWWSFNRSMPEIIGLSVCLIVSSIVTARNVNKGMMKAAQTGNDGTIEKIRSNRKVYPQVDDNDINPTSQSMFQDELVLKEQERVKNIIKGEEPSETLTVSNLKKFFITKKPKKASASD